MESDDGHPEPYLEHHADIASAERQAEIIEQIWALYNAGVPLFTRDQLITLEEQIATKPSVLEIPGMNGKITRDACIWERRKDL